MTSEDAAGGAATFAAELELAEVPPSVRDRAGLTVADTVGAICGGTRDDAVAALARDWTGAGRNGATVVGVEDTCPPHRAAFLNATAGTVLELDEGHRFAGGHPAVHVLPPLLADAESSYVGAEDFLASFVVGYEVAARAGRATSPLADGYHPHGVWGVVGGAAAVARNRGLSPAATREAMATAANYAQHTRFAAATEGATVRNTYAGMSALAALVAVDQVSAGFTGLADGVARHLEPATAGGVDRDALSAALGERWEVEHGYFKVHAACRFTHPVLDAIARLRERADLAAADVAGVTVETYPAAARLTPTDPENALQAKFSIPFAVATAIRRGETGPAAFAEAAITPETVALAERVEVSVGEAFAERAPDQRGARVTVDLTDGTRLGETVRAARGGEAAPFSEAEVRGKFEDLVGPVLGEDRTADLWTAAREPAAPRVICALAGP